MSLVNKIQHVRITPRLRPEGAIGDWGALHLRQDLGADAGLAAAAIAYLSRDQPPPS